MLLPKVLVLLLPDCRDLACGSLTHSSSVCLYWLAPEGPTATDVVIMSALSKLVPLVPVVGNADTLTEEHAKQLVEQTQELERYGFPAPEGAQQLYPEFHRYDICAFCIKRPAMQLTYCSFS